MGGKRAQHNSNATQGGSTDHKHKGGENRVVDEHLMELDKQELQSNPHAQPMIPEPGTNPAVRELRERKKGQHLEKEVGLTAGERADEKVEEKLDGTLSDSFPASDPPAMP